MNSKQPMSSIERRVGEQSVGESFAASPAITEFFPHYQPLIELETGGVAGYEALARQRDRQGRVVSAAGLFFDPEGSPDWVRSVDRHVRETALREFALFNANGFLALNISPAWMDRLSDKDVSPTVAMIERCGIDPRRVVLEVTEREGKLENIQRLTQNYQRHGIKVAVDDFGSGASQVDRIVALEPDLIKLDMSLFKAAARGGAAADIALAITALAKRAGCRIVCEGVETKDEFDFSVECGADLLQGWLYAAALPCPTGLRSFAVPTNAYKSRYLERKAEVYRESHLHHLRVEQQVYRLKEWLNACEGWADVHKTLPAASFTALGIARFYICNTQGTQISPNFELANSGLEPQIDFQGRNWSHRPYFAKLIGIYTMTPEQLVVSEPYRDLHSGKLCRTYALALSSQEILILDLLVADQVLFVR